MVVVFFFAGEASAEAVVDFLVVVELFLVVDVPCVVEAVVGGGSSFFWVWQPRNATVATAVIKVKTVVFIWSWLS